MMKSDMLLRTDAELAAIAQEYAADRDLFLDDFAAAWTRIMNADRFQAGSQTPPRSGGKQRGRLGLGKLCSLAGLVQVGLSTARVSRQRRVQEGPRAWLCICAPPDGAGIICTGQIFSRDPAQRLSG